MKILFLGLPGSGKTTQGTKLAKDLGLAFIGTGVVLREAVKRGDDTGLKVKEALSKGELADSSIVAAAISQKLKQAECKNGFIIDGYPRSPQQLKYFDPGFDTVIHLNISKKEAIRRLLLRGREDDNPDAIETRFHVQDKYIDELLDYYKHSVKVIEMDGTLSIGKIHESIMEQLGRKTK